MAKKFKAKNMRKLDNPLRRKVLPQDKVIKIIDIKKGQKIADIGCGIGYFTIPIAKFIGEDGLVYAIDINEEMLNETKRRVSEEKLKNVRIVHSRENDFFIEDNSVDLIFTATVFHELNDSNRFLDECKRILKDNGKLVVLEWNKIEEEIGPPINHRIDIEQIEENVNKKGFIIEKTEYINNSFYIIKCSI